jgi:hypothetical protein
MFEEVVVEMSDWRQGLGARLALALHNAIIDYASFGGICFRWQAYNLNTSQVMVGWRRC